MQSNAPMCIIVRTGHIRERQLELLRLVKRGFVCVRGCFRPFGQQLRCGPIRAHQHALRRQPCQARAIQVADEMAMQQLLARLQIHKGQRARIQRRQLTHAGRGGLRHSSRQSRSSGIDQTSESALQKKGRMRRAMAEL